MPDGARWEPGDQVLLREVTVGKIWTVRPVTVVEDSPELIALYLAPGTVCKQPRSLVGERIRLRTDDWLLVDDPAPWGTLRLHIPGTAHDVWAPKLYQEPRLDYWYVNLQEPLRRTPLGFDFMDQVLDVIISLDLAEWHLKDEDELEEAVARGILTTEEARAIRAEGERAIQRALAGLPPFEDRWTRWSPPAEWSVPPSPSAGTGSGERRPALVQSPLGAGQAPRR